MRPASTRQQAVAVWRDPARRGRQDIASPALLEDFAALATAHAQPVRALRLVGAADALRAASGQPRYPLHQVYLDRGVAPARRRSTPSPSPPRWPKAAP